VSNELALIRTLQSKEFYNTHKGIRCPDTLFSKDIRKIKQTLDYAMKTFERDVTVAELEALFFAHNSSLTTATRMVYLDTFAKLKKETPMHGEIAEEVMSRLFQQVVGEQVASIGFDYVNGTETSLEPLRQLINFYGDDFLPDVKVEWEDISIERLLDMNTTETQWKFNIPSLRRRVEGVSGGHLMLIGARSNVGKTSFSASLIAAEGGFAQQGAKCWILCNEEPAHRVGARYLTAASNMTMEEIRDNPALAASRYAKVKKNISIKDITGKDMTWIESVIKVGRPDIVVVDIADKSAVRSSDKTDQYLKDAAIHARNIAKEYGCVFVWVSQLSAEAEGKVMVNQSMLEGSKTGKAAETDLMLLLSKNTPVEGSEDEDTQRHINIAKNKISGWHGLVHCDLDYKRAVFKA